MYKLTPVRQTASQDLSSAALSFSYEMQHDGMISWIGIKFSTTSSETITITFDSSDGANYDILLDSTDVSSGTNFAYVPSSPIMLKKGDILKVETTDNGSATAYMTMFVSEFHTFLE
jgi:hypothetical protein